MTKTNTRRRWGTGSIWEDAKGVRARHPSDGQGAEIPHQAGSRGLDPKAERSRQTERHHRVRGERRRTRSHVRCRVEAVQGVRLPYRHERSARDDRTVWKRLSKYVPPERTQPFWHVQRIRDLRQGHVDDYKARRNAEGAAPDTLRLELALLRRLANWCEERGLCEAPRVKWRLPVSRARRADPVSEATYEKLLEHANPMQAAMLTWYWCTGCRPSELTAIRRAEFDPKKRLVTIPSLKTGKRTGLTARQFPLERQELIRSVRERDKWWRKIAISGESILGCAASEARSRLKSEWLFPGKTGEQIAEGGYAEALASCYKRAGMPPKVDVIGYRHAFVTRFLQKGGDALTLARLMGTSMAMIERTYGHLMMEHAREVLRRI